MKRRIAIALAAASLLCAATAIAGPLLKPNPAYARFAAAHVNSN